MNKSYWGIVFFLAVITAIVVVAAFHKQATSTISKIAAIVDKSSSPPPTPTATPSALLIEVITPKTGGNLKTPTTLVSGKTTPGAFLTLNDRQLAATSDGTFKLSLPLEKGLNPLLFSAATLTGQFAETEVIISFLPEPSADTSSPSSVVADLSETLLQGKVSTVTPTSLEILSSGTTYQVDTSSSTKFLHRWGAKATRSTILVGNEVAVYGEFTSSEKLHLKAAVVRNLSSRLTPRLLVGKIDAVDADGFLVSVSSPDYSPLAVTLNSSTSYLNRRGQPLSLSSYRAGDSLILWGLWDASAKTLTSVGEALNLTAP